MYKANVRSCIISVCTCLSTADLPSSHCNKSQNTPCRASRVDSLHLYVFALTALLHGWRVGRNDDFGARYTLYGELGKFADASVGILGNRQFGVNC